MNLYNKVAHFAALISFTYVTSSSVMAQNTNTFEEDGIRLTLELNKTEFREGETISLRYHKVSNERSFTDYSPLEFTRCLKVMDENGNKLGAFGARIDHKQTPLLEYEGEINISTTFFNVEFDASRNEFVHIGPGHYRIYHSCSPSSAVLDFDVVPNTDLPDSLWNGFARLKVIYQGRRSTGLSENEALRESKGFLDALTKWSAGSPLRRESIETGFLTFSLNRSAWNQQDSLAYVDLLFKYADEPDVEMKDIISRAVETLFTNVSSSDMQTALTSFAEQMNDPRALEAVAPVLQRYYDLNH